ncbi:MAG TPA: GNAT family N-acetyltransferase [Thermoleophilaceae bacterium]
MSAPKEATADPKAAREAPPLAIRPAEKRDAEAVAGLYVQLWETELPMLLVAGREETKRFLVRHLLAEDGRRLRNNYVGEYEGEVVAVYGVSTKEDPRPGFGRPGVVRDIVASVGIAKLPKLIWPLVQNLVTPAGEEWPGTLYISNLVIAHKYRKYGFGEQIFGHYVDQAVARGCDRIAGQVMDPRAVKFYEHMGTVFPVRARNDGPRPVGRLAGRIGVDSVLIWSDVPRA